MSSDKASTAAMSSLFKPGDRVTIIAPYRVGHWVTGYISHPYIKGQAVELKLDPPKVMGVEKKALEAAGRVGCLVFPELIDHLEGTS